MLKLSILTKGSPEPIVLYADVDRREVRRLNNIAFIPHAYAKRIIANVEPGIPTESIEFVSVQSLSAEEIHSKIERFFTGATLTDVRLSMWARTVDKAAGVLGSMKAARFVIDSTI